MKLQDSDGNAIDPQTSKKVKICIAVSVGVIILVLIVVGKFCHKITFLNFYIQCA